MTRNLTDAINSYVTDMLALEEHISKAVKAQIEEFESKKPDLAMILQQVDHSIERHIRSLRSLAETRHADGGFAEALKRAASILAGAGVAAVNLFRHEKAPKDVRDDYTAISLAAIGYVMLHTTAVALDDHEVAEVARLHLADHAKAIMLLHNVIPSVVIGLLREEGLPAREDVLPQIAATLNDVWSSSARQVPEPDEVPTRV